MHCVQLSPDEGYEKYMYLGQLLDGVEAMDFTRKGVAVLQQHIQALQTAAPAGTSWPSCEEEQVEARCLGGALCGALCSLSEMILNQADDIAGVTAEVEGLLAQVCPCNEIPACCM